MKSCPERRFRTLFISDVHLGARGSQADRLLDFLRSHDADTIYLVGDIVDGWALQSNWYWPQSHNDFVQKMLRKARKGAKIIYVPGNHDEFLRNYYGTHFGGIDVVENTIHVGVDGQRYLVIHGDIFDLVVQNARWLAHLGDKAYDFAIQMNRLVNFFRRAFGVPYWSLSQWAKLKVKNAVNYIGAFEQTLAAEARRHGADGVICGHIHYATIRDEHGIRYMNCGDWVESCTALAEHEDGRFRNHHLDRSAAPDGSRRPGRGAGRLMRILVATDAWHPQVNGVVRTLAMMAEAAKDASASRSAFSPRNRSAPSRCRAIGICGGVAVPGQNRAPDRRRAARQHSHRDRRADRTAGAALLPQARIAVHHELSYPLSGIHLRAPADPGILDLGGAARFHGPSQAVMAATPALASELRDRGFRNVVLWPRGVDAALFHPRDVDLGLPRPVFLCVGRVAVEKNLEAFLDLDLPGTKLIVGDGPARAALARKYPQAVFLGARQGEELARGLCGGRRVRVPEQDRHLRPGAAGGAGQRPAGRGVSGDRPPRRHRQRAGRRAERRSAHGLPGRAAHFAASLPRICRRTYLGSLGAAPSSKTSPMSPTSIATSDAVPFAAERPRFVA